MPRVITANVNGIRAAAKRGGLEWLADAGADVICLQEVRATSAQLAEVLGASAFADWHVAESPSSVRLGHSGVAILSRHPLVDMHESLKGEFDGQGRWIEASVDLGGSQVRIASAYVHTGESEGEKQAEKDRFLAEMGLWMEKHADSPALICGDINVAHTESDIKNWRGNRGKAGFLESERAHLTYWRDELGWADLGRRFGGDGPGPYTWWSWRGKGFDTDGGWRIDYVLASPAVAGRALGITVAKAATYAERWSDHAPVVADFS